MPFCTDCGRPTLPDESGLCDGCLAYELSSLRHRANVWDVNTLRARAGPRGGSSTAQTAAAESPGVCRRRLIAGLIKRPNKGPVALSLRFPGVPLFRRRRSFGPILWCSF